MLRAAQQGAQRGAGEVGEKQKPRLAVIQMKRRCQRGSSGPLMEWQIPVSANAGCRTARVRPGETPTIGAPLLSGPSSVQLRFVRVRRGGQVDSRMTSSG